MPKDCKAIPSCTLPKDIGTQIVEALKTENSLTIQVWTFWIKKNISLEKRKWFEIIFNVYDFMDIELKKKILSKERCYDKLALTYRVE